MSTTTALAHRNSTRTPLDLSILPTTYSGESKQIETESDDESKLKGGSGEIEVVSLNDESNRWSASYIYTRYRPFFHAGICILILGWWIAGIVRVETRNQWIVTTIISWFTLLWFFFEYVPSSKVGDPIGKVWETFVSKPFFLLPKWSRYSIGWIILASLILGSAFGVPLPEGGSYRSRGIPVLGVVIFQVVLWITSENRSKVNWHTIIVGLVFQQIIALFVLKTQAGYDIFSFLSGVLAKFLGFSGAGVRFFFSEAIYNQHFFFINVSAVIIFFIAVIYVLYYLGAMQFLIEKCAWFFSRTMGVSGVEAIVAAASPFIGQGESACLVKPYVPEMTASELHVVFTSGFSTISGSTLAVYLSLGIPAQFLLTASIMSIPASISISKMRMPEVSTPLTKGRYVEVVDPNPSDSAIQALSAGAWFGLKIAGLIIANVLVILSVVALIDSLLTWWGGFFSINGLTLELIFSYIFYPLAWLMGVDQQDVLQVSRLLGIKFVQNEFVAYQALGVLEAAGTITARSYIVSSFALAGFSNLGSLGIQIGVLTGLAGPKQKSTIAKVAVSALICGFLSTCQTAALAGMLL